MNVTKQLRGRLVVSCQAREGSPFHDADAMAVMARAVLLGGASALRLESVRHVRRMAGFGVPVIGLIKRRADGQEVYITPTAEDVADLVEAGASVVATDATPRSRPGGARLADLVRVAHDLGALVMGDVDSVESAGYAESEGVDWVGTTLAGYTAPRESDEPDVELVAKIAQATALPVIAEGRYSRPEQVGEAFARGAWAVVVGTAISDPVRTAARFAQASPRSMEAAS